MRARLFGTVLGLCVAATLAGSTAASASSAPAAGSQVQVTVVRAKCEANRSERVTLAAISNATQTSYEWDFNGDGIFDTTPSPDSRASHTYARTNSGRITAIVGVESAGAVQTGSVTFSLGC